MKAWSSQPYGFLHTQIYNNARLRWFWAKNKLRGVTTFFRPRPVTLCSGSRLTRIHPLACHSNFEVPLAGFWVSIWTGLRESGTLSIQLSFPSPTMSNFASFKQSFKGDISTPTNADYTQAISRWALNAPVFGVVTQFVYKLHFQRRTVFSGNMLYSADTLGQLIEVIDSWWWYHTKHSIEHRLQIIFILLIH